MNRNGTPILIVIYSFAFIWMLLAAFPFLWTMWGSFKFESDFFGHWSKAISGVDTRTFTDGSAFTFIGYEIAFSSERMFGKAILNTLIVTVCTMAISLTFGTLGGYALARSTAKYAFVLLIVALVFRALPHITLVSGYMRPLFQLGIWGDMWVAILVLVAINQPFTLWMMRSFFMNVPRELDESAMIDGCSRIQGFWHVIMPVMWPGVITTGLFSFLLAYNDFAITSSLLSQENTTMIPRISSFLGSAQTDGDQMAAVAAVVTATAPLFVLVMVFQRQIVSGLTSGAVKG